MHASPCSQLPGSPHSSPCFTFGHGVELRSTVFDYSSRATWPDQARIDRRYLPIFILPRAAPLVLAVVILRTGVALPAEPRRSLARLGLVVAQHVIRVLPFRVLVHQVALLVEYVRPVRRGIRIRVRILQRLDLLDVVHGRAQVVIAVREGAMRAILHAKATGVRVVHAHARLVVAQVITPLRVARGTM